MHRDSLWVLALVMAAAGSGCASRRAATPQALPPPVRAEVSYTLGSPLEPTAPNAPTPGGDALVLRLEGYGLRQAPADAGESLAARGDLVIDSVNEPFATAPAAAEAVRLVVDPAALPTPPGGTAAATALDAPLPAGCTAVISFAKAGTPILRVGIVSPAAGAGGRPRLLVTAQQEVTEADPDSPGERGRPRERTLLIDWPLRETAGEFALLFPPPAPHVAPPEDSPKRRRRARREAKANPPLATVWRVRVEPAGGNADAQQAAFHILAGLRNVPQAAPVTRGALLSSTLSTGVGRDDASLRRVMLSVCGEAGSDLASEAALLLEGKALTAVSGQVAGALAAAPADADTAVLGWLADRAALSAMAKLQTGNELSPAGAAMLSARFGEVGRDPAAVAELAAASPTRADFDTRLRAESVILLDDASPASRVRALEWLAQRNEAPQNYDPMSPSPQRRRAIDEYVQSLAQPTTQASTQPATQTATQPATQTATQTGRQP